MFNWINNLWIAILMLVFMSLVISKASDKLGDVLHILGLKLKIPTSVRGATLDAISSSFPEFSTAMIAVLVYKKFTDVGVPTISGSAIFNMLIIPMATIFAYKGKNLLVKVEKNVIYRDMIFYVLSIGTLIIFTYLGAYTPISGLILVTIYVGYILKLYYETKKYRKNKFKQNNAELEVAADITKQVNTYQQDKSYTSIILWIIIMISIIWISIDALIQSATIVSSTFGIPQYIVSVVIIAACTSIPDTFLSIKSAKEGDADGAVSNAVGSNIFDICICLGLPMLIAGKTIQVSFQENIGVLIFVVISMLTTTILLLKKKGVVKRDAYIMLGVYIVFITYIIGVALGIFI